MVDHGRFILVECIVDNSSIVDSAVEVGGTSQTYLFGKLSLQSIDKHIHCLTRIHFRNDTEEVFECCHVIEDGASALFEGREASTGGVNRVRGGELS